MEMTYDQLNTDEVRGTTQADYLISLDADFRIADVDQAVYEESAFPVVELARSLLIWLDTPDRSDFEFESMSFEEVGSVAVRQTHGAWVCSSVFAPESSSEPVEWVEIERCIRAFVSRVEQDLRALGIDPDKVTRR